jgi:hypothetical protein
MTTAFNAMPGGNESALERRYRVCQLTESSVPALTEAVVPAPITYLLCFRCSPLGKLRNFGVGLEVVTGTFPGTPAVTSVVAYGLISLLGTIVLATLVSYR